MSDILSTLPRPFSPVYLQRVREAVAECDRYIALEGPRDPSLRPPEAVELLEKTKAHRARLLAILAEHPPVLTVGDMVDEMRALRARTGDKTLGHQVEQGRFRLVRTVYGPRSATVTPLSDWQDARAHFETLRTFQG